MSFMLQLYELLFNLITFTVLQYLWDDKIIDMLYNIYTYMKCIFPPMYIFT